MTEAADSGRNPNTPAARCAWICARVRVGGPAALVGGLAFVEAERMGLVTALGVQRLFDIDDSWLLGLAMLLSGALASTRARALPWIAAGTLIGLRMVVGWTPLAVPLVHRWVEHDEPMHADAIVVLSSDVTDEGRLNASGLVRYVAALELVRARWAPLLVRTDLSPLRPDDTADARSLAAGTEVEIALVGPVASTRDEALATARLARERGLRRVIVVTQPMHERRAAAAFRAVGLDVIACPAPERRYSLSTLKRPGERLEAFRDLVTELAAWTFYAIRGWV